MIPFIGRETTCGQHVRKLVLGVNMFDLYFGESKLILSNNQSNETLRVLHTCLIVGRLPLMIILITASLSSKNAQPGFALRIMCVCGHMI